MANINQELKDRSGVIGTKNRRLDFKKMDPNVASVISKLVEESDGQRTNRHGSVSVRSPNEGLLDTISEHTTRNVNETNSMSEILPDIELARQILVSSILSPNDLYKVELRFTHEKTTLDPTIVQAMTTEIESYFEETYKIKPLLSAMLSEALFDKGAYPMLVLPENAIDRAINSGSRVGTESIRNEFGNDGQPSPLGILGDPKKDPGETSFSLESFKGRYSLPEGDLKIDETLGISLTDNPSVLKLPILHDKMVQERVDDAFSVSVESPSRRKNKSHEQDPAALEKTLYQKRKYSFVPIMPIEDENDEDNYGHPLVMKLPTESVIPVHVPSNPEDHLGYFILLDSMGNPLSKALESDYYNELQSNLRANKELGPRLLDRTMQGIQGTDTRANPAEIEQMVNFYTDQVEKDLLNSLKNGIYGDAVEIARPQEIFRIMLARAAAKMQTRMLYVPASLLTYIAFDYNSFGIGKSLLEKSRLLGSIRSVMMFANTMAAVRNSVGRERLNITLDPNDPEPNRTVEFLVHEYTRTSRAGFPLGESNPNNLVDYLQKAGISLQVSGNPRYPETSMDVESNQRDLQGVDTELEDNLRRRHIMSWGLSPEAVDMSTEVDFATSVVNSNLLLSKRVMLYQDKFVEFLVDFIRKYTKNSGKLKERLGEIIEENKGKLSKNEKDMTDNQIIVKFLNALRVALPSPDNSSLESQFTAYETYERALDMALEAYFSPDFLTSNNMDALIDSADETRFALKAYFLRRWLRHNNMLPELNALTTFDNEDGEAFDLMESHQEHIEGISKSLQKYMEAIDKQKHDRELRNRKLEEKQRQKEEEWERKQEEERQANEPEEPEEDLNADESETSDTEEDDSETTGEDGDNTDEPEETTDEDEEESDDIPGFFDDKDES